MPAPHHDMEESVHRAFGYVIAYLLPGFVCLWAITLTWPQFRSVW